MKILVDIRPLMDAKYSGVSEYVYRLLQAIFAIDQKNEYILFCNAAHSIAARLPKFDQSNVRIVCKHIPNKVLNYAMLWPFGRPYFDKLVGEKIDIFFMPHLQFAAVSPKVKTVLTIHDLSFLIDKRFFSWRKNVWHWFINAKKLTKRFDYIVAVSEHTKQDLVEVCGVPPEKIRTIHSGIGRAFYQYEANDPRLKAIQEKYNLTKPFILFLATLEPRKNLEALIEAFNQIKQKGFADYELVLAGGRGWKSGSIFKAIEDSEYKKEIRILDYVADEERPALYNLATVFAYPSFYEGFGFPPLEAMACATPVIAAADSSLPEIVGNAAILIDPYNPNSLAAALESVLESPELQKELSLAGKERAKNFSWERSASAYLSLFEQIGERS